MVFFDPALQHATCHSWPHDLRLCGGARRVSGCQYQSKSARTSASKNGAVPLMCTRQQKKRTKTKNKKNLTANQSAMKKNTKKKNNAKKNNEKKMNSKNTKETPKTPDTKVHVYI